jgi:Flp pilus assembly protein TadG
MLSADSREAKAESLILSTDAAEIAEAALVLPLVFMFLLGIVWFGRAFNIYSTIQQAAQQGALTAAREACATCAGGGTFPTTAAVTTAVENVLTASDLQVSQIIADAPTTSPTACPSPYLAPTTSTCTTAGDNVTVCYNVELNAVNGTTSQTPLCGTAVVFQYPFQFYLPFTSLNMQRITLTAQAQSRMEN